MFTSISSSQSGIDFVNILEETLESNYYQYMYTYIGGGVASGDINNDGLVDLYFTSNSSEDKLYLNLGEFKFKEISLGAGISKNDGFNTGVTMVDVNNDGFLDIYVSRGGWKDGNNKFANLLYINNGDLTFTERAEELGLADANRTIQATFFDYDKDNDLDVYVSNTPDITSRTQVLDLDKIQKDPKTLELKGSDRLYNNDGTGHFTDVSDKAGLQYDIGFGLNPQVGDLNNDGWLDVYVCNDFNVPDLAYINNGDGTFTESRDKLFKHMSFNSMGSDMADINNDGLLDLMTLDMNPEDYVRSKTTMAMTSVDQFELMVEKGYHYQYMHNMLQLNNGNGTFSEISKMAGMANTDWSWALLSADFDLDGYNDIYVTNGVFRDVIDRDKNNEILEILRENGRKPTSEDFLRFAKILPQQKLNNYFFKNNGDTTYEDVSIHWADSILTFSNGAIYSDLDNDGDLDVVVNNINEKATLLKNNASDLEIGNFLKLSFKGPEKNPNGLGVIAKVYLKDNECQVRQLINTRGFLSSVSNVLHFGIEKENEITKLIILWPDGKQEVLTEVTVNQLLTVDYANAVDETEDDMLPTKSLFSKLPSAHKHIDPYFNDYNLQVLLPHKLSQTGPGVAKADVDGDGLEDVYIGGGRGQSGQLLLGGPNGSFRSKNISAFTRDAQHEDQAAAFLDVDSDGDLDLYVVSGSYEYYQNPRLLQDRLYLNDGKGDFSKSDQLPDMLTSGSVVVQNDYDQDGDIDLFVGGRVIPGKYPYAPTSYLLLNNGSTFDIATRELAPELETIGMVTDAVWKDINGDSKIDLIVTGEWMGIEVFINEGNKLVKNSDYNSLSAVKGWWNELLVADIDNDGDQDIIAGNLGLNYKFHASKEEPFDVYTTDFDFNGSVDVVLAKKYNGKQVPVRGKSCMTQQLPHLASKIPTYTDFASKDLEGIVGKRLENALHYQATEFRSGIFINGGNDSFSFRPFNNKVQQSPINSVLFDDFDADGNKDLVLAGNNYQSEVETTRADAGIGSFLKGDGQGGFVLIPNSESGFFADKDVRNMITLNTPTDKLLMVINNNDYHDIFKVEN
ncbi:VCBS repeat-containing protein [Ulvibacterium marinum]|uniref:VCBS repeat-containing protein n=1 Tax=Ulvibacterium marinum TaxID=2419782 RepID=UPI001FE9A5D6|nr:VCBS repeat-containing protein [Ulvibacterium marinum]